MKRIKNLKIVIVIGLVSLIFTFQNCSFSGGQVGNPQANRQSFGNDFRNSNSSGGNYDGKTYQLEGYTSCQDGNVGDSLILGSKTGFTLTRENCKDLKVPLSLGLDQVKTDNNFDDYLVYKNEPLFKKLEQNADLVCEALKNSTPNAAKQFGVALVRKDSKGQLLARMVIYSDSSASRVVVDTDYNVVTAGSVLGGEISVVSSKGDFAFQIYSRNEKFQNGANAKMVYVKGQNIAIHSGGGFAGNVELNLGAYSFCTAQR